MVDGGGLWGGVGMLECYRSSDSRMDRTSPRLQLTPIVGSVGLSGGLSMCDIFRSELSTSLRASDSEQEQVVSLVQFPPTRPIVSLNSTGLLQARCERGRLPVL